MCNIKLTEKFARMDTNIWKRTKLDSKGRCVLPQKLRTRLGLNGNSEILWIDVHHRNGKSNEFVITIGVKNE